MQDRVHDIPPYIEAVLKDCIEVTLPPDNFLKVKETLTRIGVASKRDQTLFQSCHILHKKGRYFIVMFKELFLLDGKASRTVFDESDRARRNTIANLLDAWGLIELVDPLKSAEPVAPLSSITIIPFRDKQNWTLVSKYEVGKKGLRFKTNNQSDRESFR